MKTATRALTMCDAIFPRAGLLRDATLVLSFSWVTALCAQIAFYIGPVPITGQTLAVLMAGVVLGSKRGALSQLAYLGQGALGLPIFAAGHSGIPYMLGPTGGYLAGFVVAAFVVGWLAERGWGRHLVTTAAIMVVGNIVIYGCGLIWLSRFVPGTAVLGAGLFPFIPGDIIKLALATTTLPSAWGLISRWRG